MQVISNSKGIKGCSFLHYRPCRDISLEMCKKFNLLKRYTKLELVAEGVQAYYHSCHGNGNFIHLDEIRNSWSEEVS